jgi:signal transduction histidine kinase
VHLRATVGGRLDTAIEAAAYFLVSEALTNAAKHAHAETISVDVVRIGDSLVVTLSDDGVGGVDPAQGSGLRGLVDRVNAVGGRLEVSSAPGEGTRVRARLPTHVLGSLNGH